MTWLLGWLTLDLCLLMVWSRVAMSQPKTIHAQEVGVGRPPVVIPTQPAVVAGEPVGVDDSPSGFFGVAHRS